MLENTKSLIDLKYIITMIVKIKDVKSLKAPEADIMENYGIHLTKTCKKIMELNHFSIPWKMTAILAMLKHHKGTAKSINSLPINMLNNMIKILKCIYIIYNCCKSGEYDCCIQVSMLLLFK